MQGQELFDASRRKRLKEAEIRNNRLHFGLVFQSFNLFPQYTVLKNVTLGARFVKKGDGGGDRATGKGAAEKGWAGGKAGGLSVRAFRRQQQRVAIAPALALKPDILCFDEPTSALDPALTGEVLKVIRSLKSGESTMIVVTHEMDFARSVADRVIFMANGVIEEQGTPEYVFEQSHNEKLRAFLMQPEEEA